MTASDVLSFIDAAVFSAASIVYVTGFQSLTFGYFSIFGIRFSRYVSESFFFLRFLNGLKWTRTTDLTLIRRAL